MCYEMKWDYLTYIRQPVWFLGMIADLLNNKNKNDSAKTTNCDRRAR